MVKYMAKDFGINQRSINWLFSDRHTYMVPPYQRRYTWTEDEAEQLFDDLVEISNDDDLASTNLLGAIVVVDGENGFEFEVIDGQQRLATLSLIFCAMRAYLLKFKNKLEMSEPNLEDALRKLNNLLKVQNKSDGGDDIRVELGSIDSPVFREIINNESDLNHQQFSKNLIERHESAKKRSKESHELMINNYSSLCEKAEKWIKGFGLEESKANNDAYGISRAIISLMNHVSNAIDNNMFAFITVPNKHLAHKIFSTLNSTGLKLNQADLIKSHLLNKVDKNLSIKKQVESDWSDIFNEDLDDPDKFLYESIASRNPSGSINGIKVAKVNLYRIVYSQVKSRHDVQTWLKMLKEDAKLLKFMDHPEDLPAGQKYEKIKSDFYGIKSLNARYIRVPILAANRIWSHEKREFQEIVDCLLIFFFKFKFINDGTAEDVRAVANHVTQLLADEAPISKIIYHILVNENVLGRPDKRISNKVFEEHFKKKIYKMQTGVAKYVLASIEMWHRRNSNKETNKYIEYDFELEHILPMHHKTHWNDNDFLNETNIDDKINNYKNRLGNLTILSAKWNRGLGAKQFLKKRDHKNGYKRSDFVINKYLAECKEWTAKNISDREKHLIDSAKYTWSLDKYDKYLKQYGYREHEG